MQRQPQTPVKDVTHIYHFAGAQGAPDPQKLPHDVRYVAHLRDPHPQNADWERFWIQELPGTAGPAATGPNPPMAGGGFARAAPETATGIGPYYLKTSWYAPESAFIRIVIGEMDRASTLRAVRARLGDEVQLVQDGSFDMLAYVGGQDRAEVDKKVADLPGQVPGITVVATLHVGDYVTRSTHGPNDNHRFPPGHRF
jgi:hypothetical protein